MTCGELRRRDIFRDFVKNVSLLSKNVKSLPDRTKCLQCLITLFYFFYLDCTEVRNTSIAQNIVDIILSAVVY